VCRGSETRTIGFVDVDAAARAWIDAWTRSWRAKDPGLLAPVYAENVTFRSHPFRETQPPLEYAAWAYEDEEGDPEVWMGEPLLVGNTAAVEYWAVVVENGEQVSIAGTEWLRFDDGGRVVEEHGYWATAPGRTPPWEGWGVTSAR
jgi:SnoaL-like protein